MHTCCRSHFVILLSAYDLLDSEPMSAPWPRGGPKLGTSPGKLRCDWIRSEQLRVTFRPAEFKDLKVLAAHWQVPVATAVWAIMHERLAHFRRIAPEHGKHGRAIAAGLATLGAVPIPQPEETDH